MMMIITIVIIIITNTVKIEFSSVLEPVDIKHT